MRKERAEPWQLALALAFLIAVLALTIAVGLFGYFG